jgi:hypothetical protein
MEPVILESFRGVFQAQPDWCWAAANASIYNYYGARAKPIRVVQPQCVFIIDQEGIDGCCRPDRPGTCIKSQCFNRATSVPEHLNMELAKYGLLEFSVNCDGTDQKKGTLLSHGGFDGDEVRRYIDTGRPIGLRIVVSMDGDKPISHFLIIIGYYPVAADRIVIWDPYLGERHLTLEELVYLYGPLEQKYLTKQAPGLEKFTVHDPKRPQLAHPGDPGADRQSAHT